MRAHPLILLLATSIAHADPTVLAIDGKDIYIDTGARDGVGAGSELELLHEIVASDPVTHAVLHDHFALGTLVVARAGDKVCVARAEGELAARVLVGDHARLASAKRTFADPWQERVAAGRPALAAARPPGAPPLDHAALARDAWRDTLGQSPEQRIERWKQLVAADPGTPYIRAIDAEVKSLRTQIAARDAALAKAKSGTLDDKAARIAELVPQLGAGQDLLLVTPIDRTVPGRAIALAFLTRSPTEIGQAYLYVRRHGEPGFRRQPLARDGDAYLRGTVDASLVREPGLEWYVEVANSDGGNARPVIGSHEAPLVIDVEQMVGDPPPQPGRSHVDLHVDYVDWQGKQNKGFDEYYQAEADFTYRFLDPVYAVRLGFGTLSGIGGPKDVIDADPMHCLDSGGVYRCTRVTFTYVYTEIEHRLAPNVAIMIRPQAGLLTADEMPSSSTARCDNPDAAGCRFLTGFGARARLRLGEEAGTNLAIGAGFTRGVGTLLEASYHWLPAPVVPVQITVQVTDQPVVEDFGVRLIGDVGWRSLSWFYPSVRISYQARDIHHTGASGGLAMNFDW